jgi:hypothetical protein
MIDKKKIELIHKAIDGEISSAETIKLQTYLETNEEAKELYQNLIQTSSLIEDIPHVEPPAYLKQRIMNSIDPNLYSAKQKKQTANPILKPIQLLRSSFVIIMNGVKDAAKTKNVLIINGGIIMKKRVVFVISGVVLAGAIIVGLVTSDQWFSKDTKGTMGNVEKASKHRSEQITEEDVVLGGDLEGRSRSMMTWQERASELENVPALERAHSVARLAPLDRTRVLKNMQILKRRWRFAAGQRLWKICQDWIRMKPWIKCLRLGRKRPWR